MTSRLRRQISSAAAGCARRHRAAVRPVSAGPVAQHRHHGGGARHCRDGAQPLHRLYRPGLVRPRRLVRHRRLCGRADPAQLVQQRYLPAAAAGGGRRRRHRDLRRLRHPAPARRLFLAADAGAVGADLHHRLPLDRGDRRRGRPRRLEARQHRAVQPRQCAELLHRRLRALPRRALSPAAAGALAVRPCADGDPREPVARHLPGLSGRALQARRLRDLGRRDRFCRRADRIPELPGLRRSGLGAVLRRVARDRRDRRHAQHAGAGDRRAVLHPVPRIVFDLDLELAAVVRPDLRRLRAVFAGRPRRHLGDAVKTLVAAAGRSRRDEPPENLRRPAAAGLPAAERARRHRARGARRLEDVLAAFAR